MKRFDFKSFFLGLLFSGMIVVIIWQFLNKDIGRYQVSATGGTSSAWIIDTKTGETKVVSKKKLPCKSFQDIH